jgi:hypothetical protein
MGDPSLWATGFLGSVFQVWAPGEWCSSTAGTGEPRLQVVGALGPTCWHRLPGAVEAAAGSGKPSLRAVRVLGPECWSRLPGAQSSGTAASSGEPSLQAVGVLGPDCHAGFMEHRTVPLLPAGLCFLLPVEQQETWVLLTQGCQFPWHIRVKVAGHVLGKGEAPSS